MSNGDVESVETVWVQGDDGVERGGGAPLDADDDLAGGGGVYGDGGEGESCASGRCGDGGLRGWELGDGGGHGVCGCGTVGGDFCIESKCFFLGFEEKQRGFIVMATVMNWFYMVWC